MSFTCTECGYTCVKWLGRCPECQAWGTLEEKGAGSARIKTKVKKSNGAKPITAVDATLAQAKPTYVSEFDRVLGGGIVPGAVVLLSGEPGVGKSTLLLDVASRIARFNAKVLYVTGEESAGQVRLRAERINAIEDTLLLAAETDLGATLGMIEAEEPALLVVDSIQTLASSEVDGVPGGVTQVREVAAALIREAKARNLPTVLVGHITKDGSIAGPRLLEHLVDVVCTFEGERHSRLRMLRSVKNRFGPTDEVGCFDMTENGIQSLEDPSGLFLSRSSGNPPGTCLTVTQEGKRPLLVEVQSLITPSAAGQSRRSVSGVDSSRVAMMLAVLSQHIKAIDLSKCDVFTATVGGAKLAEPASDLAICLSLASAAMTKALTDRFVAIGEISLSGEIRNVPNLGQRLNEAARLGIRRAVVAKGALRNVSTPGDMEVKECELVAEAVSWLLE
ncbi:DNA repair protein RadA/Sms [Brevibacterium sanguinis]|uniref:DNA repair protein RadA n=2 Tax=Brevibacterium TaxID=1696 RepID=A0A366IG44_9MICO|nr:MULTISPECIES: DNA repair protein RadA [Brevibacterium]RBP63125.1 DNA repair protein RadA/Sms [Brevibacterium sanguinis]RBP69699.1 DNA repair protein RadA/Sms [Brevibacterium celere]